MGQVEHASEEVLLGGGPGGDGGRPAGAGLLRAPVTMGLSHQIDGDLEDSFALLLGVAFDDAVVAKVRIEYGSDPLGPDDGPQYYVAVMDDFIYGEPQPAQAKE